MEEQTQTLINEIEELQSMIDSNNSLILSYETDLSKHKTNYGKYETLFNKLFSQEYPNTNKTQDLVRSLLTKHITLKQNLSNERTMIQKLTDSIKSLKNKNMLLENKLSKLKAELAKLEANNQAELDELEELEQLIKEEEAKEEEAKAEETKAEEAKAEETKAEETKINPFEIESIKKEKTPQPIKEETPPLDDGIEMKKYVYKKSLPEEASEEDEDEEDIEKKEEEEEKEDEEDIENVKGNIPLGINKEIEMKPMGELGPNKITPEVLKLHTNNKTRKNKHKLKEIEMKTMKETKPPQNVVIQPNIKEIETGFKVSGFRETLRKTRKHSKQSIVKANIICPAILKTGKNITRKYFVPSQFPKLTKLKPAVPTKGGKRTRKNY